MTEVTGDQKEHAKIPFLLRKLREGIMRLAISADTGVEMSLGPRIQEANSHLEYQPKVEYELLSKRAVQIDRAIEVVIVEYLPRVNLEFLKLFGSPRMQVEFFIPIFEEQIKKGRLTIEMANQFCQEIADGGLKLLLRDVAIGTGIGWASTKVLTLPLSVYLAQKGYPKLATSLIILDHFTAIWEIPYFSIRAIQEYRYFKKQIAEVMNIEEFGRDKKLRRRALFLGTTVFINILPSPLCWFNGVFMTFPRNTGITLTLIHHNLDKIEEGYRKWQRYKDRLKQVVSKDKH